MCKICLQNPCHPRCPNFRPVNTHVYCDKCGEMIQVGEEYIENLDGDVAHFSCVCGIRDLVRWIGCEIVTMTDRWEGCEDC